MAAVRGIANKGPIIISIITFRNFAIHGQDLLDIALGSQSLIARAIRPSIGRPAPVIKNPIAAIN